MAKKNDMFGGAHGETIIGSSVKLKGNLNTEGDITVDGKMAGNINSGGHVTLGVNAHVVGNISASSATIAGHLDGNVKVADALSVLESGQVLGDVNTGRLEVGMGGIIIGALKMKPVEAREIEERTELNSSNSKK